MGLPPRSHLISKCEFRKINERHLEREDREQTSPTLHHIVYVYCCRDSQQTCRVKINILQSELKGTQNRIQNILTILLGISFYKRHAPIFSYVFNSTIYFFLFHILFFIIWWRIHLGLANVYRIFSRY